MNTKLFPLQYQTTNLLTEEVYLYFCVVNIPVIFTGRRPAVRRGLGMMEAPES